MMQVFTGIEETIDNFPNYGPHDLFFVLKSAPKKVRDNKPFVMKIVKEYPFSFKWASRRLRNDPEVIAIAISSHPHNLFYLDDKYRCDYDFVKPLIIREPSTIQYVFPPLRDIPEFIDIALSDHVFNLQYFSEKTRDDKKLVLSFVSKEGRVVAYVSNRLKDDEDVILTAAKTASKHAYIHASERFKKSKSFAFSYLCATDYFFEALKYFHDDFDVALMAMAKSSNWLFVDEKLKRSKEFCKQMVLYNGRYLAFLYPESKADKEVVLSAVINEPSVIFEAAPEIQDLIVPYGFNNSQEILKWQIECDLLAPFSMNIIAFGRTKEFIARVHFFFV